MEVKGDGNIKGKDKAEDNDKHEDEDGDAGRRATERTAGGGGGEPHGS